MKAPTAHREREAVLNPDRLPWDQRPTLPRADAPARVYRLPDVRPSGPLGAQLRVVPVPPLTGVMLAGQRPGRQTLQVKALQLSGREGVEDVLMAFERVSNLGAALTRTMLVDKWTGFVMERACHDGEVWAFNPDESRTAYVSIIEA